MSTPDIGQIRESAVTFSFVAPVHNEAEALEEFYAQLREAAEKLRDPYEIIFVDDGSTDESLEIIQRLREQDDQVRFVSFSRNFGPQEALTAGLDYASGEAVITLDADGQHPPHVVGDLAAKWRQGYEVVYTVKAHTKDVWFLRRWVVWGVYKLISALSGMDVADQADFRLLDRKVVDAVRGARERSRFLRGLVKWMGFRQVAVEYEVEPRLGGTPSYTLGKLARMGSAGVFGFSVTPLRLIGVLGAVMLATAVIYAIAALMLWGYAGASVTANLVMLMIGLTGLQLAAVGVLGEYLGRVYEDVKGRPIYVVREAAGFDLGEESPTSVPELTPGVRPLEPSQIRLFT